MATAQFRAALLGSLASTQTFQPALQHGVADQTSYQPVANSLWQNIEARDRQGRIEFRTLNGMVRRDDAEGKPPASRRCSSPAGASPASVRRPLQAQRSPPSAGAPSSRPQAWLETAMAQAGCRKPPRREQVRGPQHEVKPAASTQLQPESRAAHVTAKATSPAPRSGGARAGGLGGVLGAARGHGGERNTRGPSAQPGSAGGKGPCGGHGVGARPREGMAGRTGPNSPERRAPLDQVRQLQRRLWAAAKRSPKRSFHALMDRIWRDDVLWEAWRRV